ISASTALLCNLVVACQARFTPSFGMSETASQQPAVSYYLPRSIGPPPEAWLCCSARDGRGIIPAWNFLEGTMELNQTDPVIDGVGLVGPRFWKRWGHARARLVAYYLELQQQTRDRLPKETEQLPRADESATAGDLR